MSATTLRGWTKLFWCGSSCYERQLNLDGQPRPLPTHPIAHPIRIGHRRGDSSLERRVHYASTRAGRFE